MHYAITSSQLLSKMAATVLELKFMKLKFTENAIVVRFKESNVDISLLWLSFEFLALSSHYQTE